MTELTHDLAEQVVRSYWRRVRAYQATRVLLAAVAGYVAGKYLERGRQQLADDVRPAGLL